MEYSCKSGICSSCIAKVESGQVAMGCDSGLSSEQKKENYILSCQSLPFSKKLSISYDKNKTPFYQKRKIHIVAGILVAFVLTAFFTSPQNQNYLIKGKYNTGHETLACNDCHKDAPGSIRQQLQAKTQHYVHGQEDVVLGLLPVDNKVCNDCHNRPEDNHPVHRFMEPRFKEARNAIHPETCNSCHQEHSGKRVTIPEPSFCVNCHEDMSIENDPLEISHKELVVSKQWESCLQCHDYHGNHLSNVPESIKDTIPLDLIKEYFNGGKDPFGNDKKYKTKQSESRNK